MTFLPKLVLMMSLGMSLNLQAGDEPKGQPLVIGQSYTLESKILKQTRVVNVYLPPDYEKSKDTFPVLYLLDGGFNEDFVHIAGIASLAADWRNIRPFIVVGIQGIDRYHELIHPSQVEKEKERLPTHGASETFRSFISKELQPFVKKHFRVSQETVIMGESAAGMFVVETLLKEPALFSGYISVSPMLYWDRQSLAKSAGEMLQKAGFPDNRRLYLTIADEGGEMQGGVDILVEALKEHGPKSLKWTYAPMGEESHATIFHPAALAAVRHFFKVK